MVGLIAYALLTTPLEAPYELLSIDASSKGVFYPLYKGAALSLLTSMLVELDSNPGF